MARNRLWRSLQAVVCPVILLALWQGWAWFNAGSTRRLVLPAPSEILVVLLKMVREPVVYEATGRTLGVTLLGFGLGTAAAIILGLALGTSRGLDRFATPTLLGLRSLPIVLYIPVALVLFEPGPEVCIALSAWITMLYCAPPVAQAAAQFDPEKRRFLKARGISRMIFWLNYLLPEIVSAIYLSVSLAITLSLAATVVIEMLLPSLDGLGSAILRARELNEYHRLWALTAVLGIAGYLLHSALLGIWRLAAPWLKHTVT